MRRRLFALLLVAAVSGAIAGPVSANQREIAAARIPALPQLPEVADVCPLPSAYRPAFVAASRATNLPLNVANVTSTWRALRGCR